MSNRTSPALLVRSALRAGAPATTKVDTHEITSVSFSFQKIETTFTQSK
jgi:hypothetical protein